MSKTYLNALQYETFEERFEYLKLCGVVGEDTFGLLRYLNQKFYNGTVWKKFKRDIIIRDNGCDLAIPGLYIKGPIVLHHIEPVTSDDIINFAPCLLDKNNVICVSGRTHRAIHFGDISQVRSSFVERKMGDTCPWKRFKKEDCYE